MGVSQNRGTPKSSRFSPINPSHFEVPLIEIFPPVGLPGVVGLLHHTWARIQRHQEMTHVWFP